MFTTDVAQEKQHTAFLHDVEQFQQSSLRKTDTVEKIVLPNAIGTVGWIRDDFCCPFNKKTCFLLLPNTLKCGFFVYHTKT